MAGTRRQSRARDTTSAHQRQRSASQIASVVPKTTIATNSKAIEIAEGVDEGSPCSGTSPQPETPVNRSTIAYCKKCDGKIGEFYNSWHKATSSYYSPALLGSYRCLLRTSDQRKEASDKTELAGCTIDLTYCPNCDNCLGFVVVDTPANGKRFRGRDFLKLQRIELRCEISPSKTITVEPQEDVAPDLVAVEGSTGLPPATNNTTTDTMSLDTPLSSSHPLWRQPAQSEPQQQRQSSQPKETLGQLLPSNMSQPPPALSRSPTIQSVVNPTPAPAAIPLSISPQPAQSRPKSAFGSSIEDVRSELATNGQKNGHIYPREPREVYFDAIERLQTQTSQNTSALAAQARAQTESADIVRQIEGSLRHEFQTHLQRQDQDLRRMSETVNQLARELHDCRQTIVSLVEEIRVTRAENAWRPSEAAQPGYQDDALELMARRIGEISHRTTDLETLRDLVAIVSGKVQRLESDSVAARQPHPQPAYPTHQPTHTTQIAHTAPPHPSQAPHFQTPARSTSIPQSAPPHDKPVAAVPPESAQKHESVPTQNGWATVNAGVKRVFENDTGSPHQGASPAPGSPKRPRLATGESQETLSMTPVPSGPSHILPSQTQPVVTSQPLAQPGPYPAPQQGVHPGAHPGLPSSQPYPPYGTQDGQQDQGWRSESQRMAESRPARGRGSRGGRGPGSRGGRVRKSMQGQQHPLGTPEWERDQWTAVPDSQASSPSHEEYPAHSTRSIVRRGGGGVGMRGGSMLMERTSDWTPEIGPRSVYPDHGSPIEVKKTRSKPVRNEEGILVRKDGRPDRRSQSSAANLRKVHARKEGQQREGEAGSTPIGLHASASAGPDTPSPTPRGQPEQNVTASVRKKHNDILGRIFPDGIDSSRKQHDYAHQVFNGGRDHTAHPRTQTSRATKAPHQVKKEQVERNEVAETQARPNGDLDMHDARATTNDQTPVDAQTPVGKQPGSAERADTRHNHDQEATTQDEESRVQIPETQAIGGSATLAAKLVEAA